MPTIHFTGTTYRGSDGPAELRLSAPGDYAVSEAKADQLARDFPDEFARVAERPTPAPAAVPSGDAAAPAQEGAASAPKTPRKGR